MVILAAGCVVVGADAAAVSATPAATCSFSAGVLSITFSAPGSASIQRSGDLLAVSSPAAYPPQPMECGGATVLDTARVLVTGSSGDDEFQIHQIDGPLEPGLGTEPGIAEIEFAVDLGTGTDLLFIGGQPAVPFHPRSLTDGGLLVNDDRDVDVRTSGIESLKVIGSGLADAVDLRRGPFAGSTAFTYGGDDTVLTGGGADVISAGSGNDEVHAGAGDDIVFGEDGDDFLSGGRGVDAVEGGVGTDMCAGPSEPGEPAPNCEAITAATPRAP